MHSNYTRNRCRLIYKSNNNDDYGDDSGYYYCVSPVYATVLNSLCVSSCINLVRSLEVDAIILILQVRKLKRRKLVK